MTNKELILNIENIDVAGAPTGDPFDGPIARALRRQLGMRGVDKSTENGIWASHWGIRVQGRNYEAVDPHHFWEVVERWDREAVMEACIIRFVGVP